MKKRALVVSISTALLISGCASMGKEGRIGQNDGSDPCYTSLNNLDEMAIYYKDERMKSIATGVLIGGATGVLAGMAAGKSDAAMIVGGVTGAIAGGFAADAYWKNKLQQANNNLNMAIISMEADLKQDADRLARMDKDLAALVRCRFNQRDSIRKRFAEGKITDQQAREEWKKWGDLMRNDQEEMKYLDEALVNIRQVEDSFKYASAAIEAPEFITKDIQKKWQQELEIDTNKKLTDIEETYNKKLSDKKIPKAEKKVIKAELKRKKAEVKKEKDSKLAEIDAKKNPNPEKGRTGMLRTTITEPRENIKSNQSLLADSVIKEANDSDGYQKPSTLESKEKPTDQRKPMSKLPPAYKDIDFFAYTPSITSTLVSFNSPSIGECKG